ncbi:hypothetical protein LQ327_08945 [Actinomycetospora endophytica]|uniref:Uncharacterized protein n=1 Tax=Actinomycetospora endophytica TaxID=2291215 RepID=A0ABS8P5H2_9PSEU|nr:hypothetical protein [Actinomycetospora endophytica]MCD2193508.1 hypothetical protein [Actinomycetospora endophytica]
MTNRKQRRAQQGRPHMPGFEGLIAMGQAASEADAAAHGHEAPGPDTQVGILADLLHKPCNSPWPSTHKASASWHVREARELLDRLQNASDAPQPPEGTPDTANARERAAQRLEDVESLVRTGDYAILAVELRDQDSARTRAIAAAILGQG